MKDTIVKVGEILLGVAIVLVIILGTFWAISTSVADKAKSDVDSELKKFTVPVKSGSGMIHQIYNDYLA